MKAAWASVVTAALASACCLGPVLLAGVGAGALGAAAVRLEPLRPVFLAVTAVLLALAFHGAYRRTATCEADGRCRAPSRPIAKLVVWVVFALVGLLVAFPYYVGVLPWRGPRR